MRLLISILVLTGCGKSSGLSPDSANSGQELTAPATQPTVSPAPAKISPSSIALDSVSDLPGCGSANDTELVYLMDTKKFETCQKGQWTSVDITGATGPAGQSGATGAIGPAGPSTILPSNEWIDPVTGIVFLIGGSQVQQSQAIAGCTSPWTLISNAILLTAREHGLETAANAPQTVWVVESQTNTPTNLVTGGMLAATALAGEICYK